MQNRSADPYAWMRDHESPAFLANLTAERALYEQQTRHLRSLRDELHAELSARTLLSDESVAWRSGGSFYYTRTVAGRDFEQLCRFRGVNDSVEVLLDENELLDDPACRGGFLSLGVRQVSPDGSLLAYSVDFTGDEVYELRIRDLVTGTDLPGRVPRTYYGAAWSAASDVLFYVVHDELYRPYQVWRRRLGGGPDVLVFQEDDARFEVTVRATRSGAYVLIETASRDTTETLLIPTSAPQTPPEVVRPRRRGVEYAVEHGGDELFLVTDDEAVEFRLVTATGREVLAGSDDTRLVRCDAFARHLVVTERHGGATRLRVIDRASGAHRLITVDPHVALDLGVNEDYDAAEVVVRTQSLIDPPSWHAVDLDTGEWRLLKRRDAPGHDPSAYVTERIHATAADGTSIPVTVAYRRGLRRDGTAPCLLNGYGAYESCFWPESEPGTACLLDRGFVVAIAHVRGGGEGGRRWWLEGRLGAKVNTFTDYLAAADMLVRDGWAGQLVTRGLSAGGLLQGAVFSMAPDRWRGVVAEVPFVDCLNSMLDPSIPLTVNEWDEWGDPREPEAYEWIRSYSPYENVPAGPRPDLLVTGSLHDPRVLAHEPAKWVAKLRATGDGRVLFRAETGAGAHTGPAGRDGRLRYEAEILAFVIEVGGRD
ncbi:S9 family peptidase [Microbispora sp. ATCC PTA-5024]|uniref:S9 family peptidase n=1 Tax=Microbispora sp. ATCC PTA-5024 TaxID=316330 RepID=UPI0003DD0962|nr:prolyl oligopeptidase family serine peptidase [Microbispora sp. ATCC PTA-5024]ETK35280.1 protease [Microbispora sp. ATCC PTA-5024]